MRSLVRQTGLAAQLCPRHSFPFMTFHGRRSVVLEIEAILDSNWPFLDSCLATSLDSGDVSLRNDVSFDVSLAQVWRKFGATRRDFSTKFVARPTDVVEFLAGFVEFPAYLVESPGD